MKLTKKTYLLILIFYCSSMSMGADMKNKTDHESSAKIKLYNALKGEFEEVEIVRKSEKEWKQILTDEQFAVTRKHGTERAFTGELNTNKEEGLYVCVGCGNHLFSSKTKFDSKTGWPSFFEPVADENIGSTEDNSFFMKRIEIHCSRCGAHLGHVFDDGPEPTFKRFCINSASLKFIGQ